MRRMGALRFVMPITAGTFIIGWLAIAGVPPFAGFWSKDEILLFAYDKSPVLWALGLVTALLTAFYMTRQVIMVFFGTARWNDKAAEHGAHGELVTDDHDAHDDHGHDVKPHESPWTMLLPLVVLAALSIVGGFIMMPFSASSKRLEHWLHPVVEPAEGIGEVHLSSGTDDLKYVFMAIAVAVALAGIFVAYLVYQKRRIKAVEPEVLANAWYYDKTVSDFMGGPGREAFEGTAWFDKHVVDGAVNGSARGVRALAGGLRKGQSGYVRAYAGIIALGVTAMLVWFVLVRGIL
jgi:NADH-quinone oxidoreductase subunit L